METIHLHDLCYKNFNINNIFCMVQHWNNNHQFLSSKNSRKKSGLLYFHGSKGKYMTNGTVIEACPGDIFYLPPYVEYTTVFYDHDTSLPSSLLIDIWLTDEYGHEVSLSSKIIKICSDDNNKKLLKLFDSIITEYTSPLPNLAKVKHLTYNLISILSTFDKINRLSKKELLCIQPGIEYLESEKDQNLSIKEIADLCCISEVYFRKLFKVYSGMSPTQFRITRKIEKAKIFLKDSIYNISEISEILGFDNPAYFSRIFKNYVGISPSQYIKDQNI